MIDYNRIEGARGGEGLAASSTGDKRDEVPLCSNKGTRGRIEGGRRGGSDRDKRTKSGQRVHRR